MSLHFKALQRFLVQSAGLAFDEGQVYLAESRLLPLAERHGLGNVNALVNRLQDGGDPELARAAIEAMTTHETFFFRDRAPFDAIRNVILPRLMALRADRRKLRIWCAACSTGQEPYSLAMILDEEARRVAGWNIEILATDLSRPAIEAARNGYYSQFEVQRGLPVANLLRYFQREGEGWRLGEHLRQRVKFQTRNLVEDFSSLGVFDLILCRNVLIYFDGRTRRDVLARLGGQLADQGYCALGASERIADGMANLHPLPLHASIGVKTRAANRLATPTGPGNNWVH